MVTEYTEPPCANDLKIDSRSVAYASSTGRTSHRDDVPVQVDAGQAMGRVSILNLPVMQPKRRDHFLGLLLLFRLSNHLLFLLRGTALHVVPLTASLKLGVKRKRNRRREASPDPCPPQKTRTLRFPSPLPNEKR